MLLSDAMRLGAMMGPQLFNKLTDVTGASCAMGSIQIASGAINGAAAFYNYQELANKFPSLHWSVKYEHLELFELSEISQDLIDFYKQSEHLILCWLIVELNNRHRYSREQIADFIVANGYDCESTTPIETPVQVLEEASKVLAVAR